MKKIAILAVSMITANAAHAQRSVTLYGIASGDVTYTSNVQSAATSTSGKPHGGSQTAMLDDGSSGLSSSRWGMIGVEDLGGGLKANFRLENGFNINNGQFGQGGTEFGRQAWVGLSSQQYGALSIGRQADTSVEFVSPLLYGWNWGNLAIHPADYDNLNFTRRANNSVEYMSDNFNGLRFGALYGVGGVAGNFTQNQEWSFGAAYSISNFSLSASIVNARDPNFSMYGNNASSSTTGNNLGSAGTTTTPASNPIIAGFASARTQQTVSIATAYNIGAATVAADYSNTQFRDLGAILSLNTMNYAGNTSLYTVGVSLHYQMSPALKFGGSVDYTDGGSVGSKASARYGQFNLDAEYALSKSTVLFADASYQRANGTDSFGRPAVAQIGYLTPSSTNKQLAISAGVMHRF